MQLKTLSIAIGAILLNQPLLAEEAELSTITVEGTKLSDVSGEEVKSADLAEALTKKVPSISIVRRSGIANDIILRGQKKDNINILIDDAKIYGACPNRMDPPTSHILTNNIDAIEVTEGPYDVENFGTLSGAVKITTKKPEQGFGGEVSLNVGSWGYKKAATTLSGGTEKVRGLVSISGETSGQYEDGDGNTFAEQIDNYYGGITVRSYKDIYRDMDAYEKRTFMGKLYVDVTDNQELNLSYTANRSDDILYPNTPMDALYDDSDILDVGYSIKNLGPYSKELAIKYYMSKVDHPMSTFYRVASSTPLPPPVDSTLTNSNAEMISHLESKIQGLKIKNSFDLNETTELTYGVDASNRNWDGAYEHANPAAPVNGLVSIPDVDTENRALFIELDKDFDKLNLKAGLRYDDTSVTPDSASGFDSNEYTALNGFAFTTYQVKDSTKLFGGIGRSTRVPDARELYFRSSTNVVVGTPTLDQTSNTEIDIGMENSYQDLTLKTKLFHSWLKDYIYYNSDNGLNKFENIDATIYGLSFSGTYFASDDISLDFGLAYQRGEKDEALAGQTDRDLAEIPPLKINLGLDYEYMHNSSARVELVAADDWSKFDADNGEQALDGYEVVNLKVKHQLTNSIEVIAGVDNVFDKTYAVSNTYKDLTLLSVSPESDVMLFNEPGRYFYLNGTYRF